MSLPNYLEEPTCVSLRETRKWAFHSCESEKNSENGNQNTKGGGLILTARLFARDFGVGFERLKSVNCSRSGGFLLGERIPPSSGDFVKGDPKGRQRS